jgi:hypothetical protein
MNLYGMVLMEKEHLMMTMIPSTMTTARMIAARA